MTPTCIINTVLSGPTPHTHTHSSLTGLSADDHTQYLLADGTRALAGAWDANSQNISNAVLVSPVITSGQLSNNLDANSQKITGLANGVAATDAATVGQLPAAGGDMFKADNLVGLASYPAALLNLTILTASGGVKIGTGAATTMGGAALGNAAAATTGGSVGASATTTGGGFAGGRNTDAINGAAVGDGAQAGEGFAGGNGADALGTGAVAIGQNATATTGYDYGVAVGEDAAVTAIRGLAIGPDTIASGLRSTALGSEAEATAAGAVQIGFGTNSTGNSIQFQSSGPVTAAEFGLIPDISDKLSLSLGGTMSADINMDGNGIEDAVITLSTFCGSLGCDLDAGSYKITNLDDGTASGDAVNKGQLDGKLSLSGGTMTGAVSFNSFALSDAAITNSTISLSYLGSDLNADSNKITNLSSGTASGDAVNKGQLDTKQDLLYTTDVAAASYTVPVTARCIIADDDSPGYITLDLPAASTAGDGWTLLVKKVGSTGNVTLDANGADTIDGAGTYDLTTQYESVTIVSDGSNWHII